MWGGEMGLDLKKNDFDDSFQCCLFSVISPTVCNYCFLYRKWFKLLKNANLIV